MSDTRVRSFKSSTPEYHRAFQTFLDHTDQKENAVSWLEQEIKRLPARSVLIDAGAGNGKLTQWVSKWFDFVVGIEPNASLLKELAVACPGAELNPSTILEAEPTRAGDFILCSHVFYYIPHEKWAATTRKLMSWLAPGGVLAIAIQNPHTDCMRMLGHFVGKIFGLAELRDIARDSEDGTFSADLVTVPATIRAPDLQTACDIAEFMLNVLPVTNPPLSSELERYVRDHFAREAGGFEMSCHQDFLRIERRS